LIDHAVGLLKCERDALFTHWARFCTHHSAYGPLSPWFSDYAAPAGEQSSRI